MVFSAGAAGFEPTNGGTKIRCLAAWRRPSFHRIHLVCIRFAKRDCKYTVFYFWMQIFLLQIYLHVFVSYFRTRDLSTHLIGLMPVLEGLALPALYLVVCRAIRICRA